jgi:hypothetical protein
MAAASIFYCYFMAVKNETLELSYGVLQIDREHIVTRRLKAGIFYC